MRTLVLQHIADEGDPFPDWREYDVIVAMSAPMSVNDDAELTWLTSESS